MGQTEPTAELAWQLAQQLQQSIGDAMLLTGLTVPELAELIRGARLYIGNDSGPMHLATAVGTPTVAIWGSSSSVRWHPWGVEHRVVQNPFSCNPCPGYRCLVASSPLCIESVTVEQVRGAVVQVIRGRDPGPRIGDPGSGIGEDRGSGIGARDS